MTDWDVLRSVRDAYWAALQDNTADARRIARNLAESYGFENVRDMVEAIVREFGQKEFRHGMSDFVRPVRRSGAVPQPVC